MQTYQTNTQIPPSPRDPSEAMRWEEGRRRRRMLDGAWMCDLEQRLQKRIGTTRRQVWGEPSQSILPYSTICRELAVLYTSPYAIRHDAADVSQLAEVIRLSGLFGLMSRVQYHTLGQRECLVRVSCSEAGRLSYRPVYCDMVTATGREDAPDLPVAVRELRLRDHPETRQPVWTMDIVDISVESNPIYKIVEAKPGLEEGQDWTVAYLGAPQSGDAYPYRRAGGSCVIPYIVWHAERTGDRMFDPYRWSELVSSSLDQAVRANMRDHTFLQASWPQRVFVGCRPAGMDNVSEDGKAGRSEIVMDPTAGLVVVPVEDYTGQIDIKQFQPGADVQMLTDVIADESARIAQDAGVSASDIQRLNSQRSGVSISLTNEGKRSAQRRAAEQMRDSDERLVMTSAILLNRAVGSSWPEGGYSIQYTELPLSPDEMSARREHVLSLYDRGLMSRAQTYRALNPGISTEQARQDLAEIDASGPAPMTPSPDEPVERY